MKKYLLALSILTTLSFGSCNQDVETIKSIDHSYEVEQFDSIGIMHNEGLSFIYKQLEDSISCLNTLDKVLLCTENATNDFVISRKPTTKNLEKSFVYIKRVFHNNNGSLRKAPLYDNGNIYGEDIADSLSQNQKNLLNKLNTIMSDDDEDITILKYRITQIEEEAESILPEEEQVVIFVATTISKHTLEYWLNNIAKWEQLFSNSENIKSDRVKNATKFSWKSVGKNDVAGGIGGAVGAGVATFFGPIGWAGWGSAILGGAAGASAYDAAIQLMNPNYYYERRN